MYTPILFILLYYASTTVSPQINLRLECSRDDLSESLWTKCLDSDSGDGVGVGGVQSDYYQVGNGNEFYLTSLRSTDSLIVGARLWVLAEVWSSPLLTHTELWLADKQKDGTALIELERHTITVIKY